MIHNLLLFLYAIAKVSCMCGFAFSIAIAIFADRIREVGIEQVRGEQLATLSGADSSWATSSPRNVRAA